MACLASIAHADPVLSVDTNRIISLARNAISEEKYNVESNKLEFVDITYRYDARQIETLCVGFRHSPVSKTTSDSDANLNSAKTETRFKAITVQMDKNGKILSVSDKASSLQIKYESMLKKTVQPHSAGDSSTRDSGFGTLEK